MLREVKGDRDKEGRKWFSDEDLDLIIWFDGTLVRGFQLCYDKQGRERALTWFADKGFTHARIDDGEQSPEKNRAPILVPDGLCPIQELLEGFWKSSPEIDSVIRSLVSVRLQEYANNKAGEQS